VSPRDKPPDTPGVGPKNKVVFDLQESGDVCALLAAWPLTPDEVLTAEMPTLRDAPDAVALTVTATKQVAITANEAVDVASLTALQSGAVGIAALEQADAITIAARGATRVSVAVTEAVDAAVLSGSNISLTTAALQLPQANDALAVVGAASVTSGSGSDFQTRRTAPGVFRSFGWDSPAELGTNMNGGPLGYTPTTSFGYDAPFTVSPVIQNAALKMTHPAGVDGAAAGGKWETRFSDDDTFVIGPNQKLYFQFRYRQSGAMQQDIPENPGGIKIAFIDCSGNVGSGSSGTPLTIVITSNGHGAPNFQAYFYSQVTPQGDFGVVANPFPGNVPPGVGAVIPANEWVYFTGLLDLRGVLTAPPYNGYHIDGSLTIDMIRADGTKIPVCRYGPGWHDAYAVQDYIGFPWKLSTQSPPTWTEWRFGKWTFLPYATGRDGVNTPIDYTFEYDELILSTQPIADPGVVVSLPAWRTALAPNTLADITADGSTQSSAFVAAGYDIPGWGGDRGDAYFNYTAWAGGVLCPDLGQWGSMVIGSNGHEAGPASTLSRFDLGLAKWMPPIGAPQIHRQVAPSYVAPPVDTEFWYNPDKVGVVDKTNYTYGGLTGLDAVDNEYVATGIPVTTPFAVGASSFKGWPLQFGMRAQTNAAMSMRYDMMCYIPPGFGGEVAGSIVFGPWSARWSYGPEALLGRCPLWVFTFGNTSQNWISHSTTVIDPAGSPASVGHTAFSEKYGKMYMFGWTDNPGTYDPITRVPSHVVVNQRYSTRTFTAYVGDACTAIITHGHQAHLLITLGFDNLSQQFCLWAADLDLVQTWNGVPINNQTDGEPAAWAIMNSNATGADFPHQRVALLNPPLVRVNNTPPPSVAWSRTRQKLIIWSPPPGRQQSFGLNGNITVAPLASHLVQTVTIPTGFDGNPNATSGAVANWKTQPWVTTNPTIALAAGTAGVHTGSIGSMYKRFSWTDALDCAVVVGAPETKPVQALRIW